MVKNSCILYTAGPLSCRTQTANVMWWCLQTSINQKNTTYRLNALELAMFTINSKNKPFFSVFELVKRCAYPQQSCLQSHLSCLLRLCPFSFRSKTLASYFKKETKKRKNYTTIRPSSSHDILRTDTFWKQTSGRVKLWSVLQERVSRRCSWQLFATNSPTGMCHSWTSPSLFNWSFIRVRSNGSSLISVPLVTHAHHTLVHLMFELSNRLVQFSTCWRGVLKPDHWYTLKCTLWRCMLLLVYIKLFYKLLCNCYPYVAATTEKTIATA